VHGERVRRSGHLVDGQQVIELKSIGLNIERR